MARNAECVLCEEVITNPICLDCLKQEIKEWLVDRNPKLLDTVDAVSMAFRSYTHEGNKCVICGQGMNICSHCYTKEMVDILGEYVPEIKTEQFWPLIEA